MSADLLADLNDFYQPSPAPGRQNTNKPSADASQSAESQFSSSNAAAANSSLPIRPAATNQDVGDDDDWGAFETGETGSSANDDWSKSTLNYGGFIAGSVNTDSATKTSSASTRSKGFDKSEGLIGPSPKKIPPSPPKSALFATKSGLSRPPRDENVLFDADDEDEFGDFESAGDEISKAAPSKSAASILRTVNQAPKGAIQGSLIDFDTDSTPQPQPQPNQPSSLQIADFATLSFTDAAIEDSKNGASLPPANGALKEHTVSEKQPKVVTPYFEEDKAWAVDDPVQESIQESSSAHHDSPHTADYEMNQTFGGSIEKKIAEPDFTESWPSEAQTPTVEIPSSTLAIQDDNPWDDNPRQQTLAIHSNQVSGFTESEEWDDFQGSAGENQFAYQSAQRNASWITGSEEHLPSTEDPWSGGKAIAQAAPLDLPQILPPTNSPESSGVPPTNIPPPGHLIPLFPPIFAIAQTNLFDPLSQQSRTSAERDKILGHHDTLEFLMSYVAISVAFARVIAGRKLRWKRDKILTQSMKIGPASASGKSGGMKLTGLDKSENAREEREVADALKAWRAQVGRLRSTVSGAGGFATVPEISDNLPVRTAKPTEGAITAPGQCVFCGLKRNERVQKVDFDVLDSFGEWWVEHWGHRDCMRFWEAQKENLGAR